MGSKANIFVIYAWEDNEINDQLLRHLNSINGDDDLSISHEFHINAWKNWKPYFQLHLDQTDVFLLLVSVDFMNSDFMKQPEFKTIIDRHKKGRSVAIPVIIDQCQWDIDFDLEDYEFNLNELKALPDSESSVQQWNSADEALKSVAEGVRRVLISPEDIPDQMEDKKDQPKEHTTDSDETGEVIGMKEEIDEAEERMLWEEAETQRRAEVKRKILEAAEASARRREEEEDRRMEEAIAKKIAEEENRLIEEAASKRRAEEQNRAREESSEKTRIEEERRRVEKVEARKRAREKKQLGRQAKKRNNNLKNKDVPVSKGKDGNRNRIARVAALVAIVVAGIWFYSTSKNDTDEQSPSVQDMNAADVEDSLVLDEKIINPQSRGDSLSKLVVGDTYKGGIVFSIDRDGLTGKLVHTADAGPMTWNEAIKIDEQLGEGWRLPTFEELELMYETVGQGASNSAQFTNELYWSATAYDEHQARLLRFWDGNSSYHYNKDLEHRKFLVRAIRDFSR